MAKKKFIDIVKQLEAQEAIRFNRVNSDSAIGDLENSVADITSKMATYSNHTYPSLESQSPPRGQVVAPEPQIHAGAQPHNPIIGEMWFNPTNHMLNFYDGEEWIPCASREHFEINQGITEIVDSNPFLQSVAKETSRDATYYSPYIPLDQDQMIYTLDKDYNFGFSVNTHLLDIRHEANIIEELKHSAHEMNNSINKAIIDNINENDRSDTVVELFTGTHEHADDSAGRLLEALYDAVVKSTLDNEGHSPKSILISPGIAQYLFVGQRSNSLSTLFEFDPDRESNSKIKRLGQFCGIEVTIDYNCAKGIESNEHQIIIINNDSGFLYNNKVRTQMSTHCFGPELQAVAHLKLGNYNPKAYSTINITSDQVLNPYIS